MKQEIEKEDILWLSIFHLTIGLLLIILGSLHKDIQTYCFQLFTTVLLIGITLVMDNFQENKSFKNTQQAITVLVYGVWLPRTIMQMTNWEGLKNIRLKPQRF